MHGRVKKDVVQPSPEDLQKQRQQVATARALFAKLLEQRRARAYGGQALEMTMKALMFHPEFPTLWGYRREILQSGEADGDRYELLQGEMRLLEKALRKSQKVYSIWFHRKWTVEQLFKACASAVDARRVLDVELDLCRRFLEVDERNFHCWNHRAHVMGLMLSSLIIAKEDAMVPEREKDQAVGSPALAESGTSLVVAEEVDSAAPEESAEVEGGAPPTAGGEEGAGEEAELSVTAAGTPPTPAGALASKVDGGPSRRHQDSHKKGAPCAPSAADLFGLDLALSKELVNRNFSNYSAWHLRTLLQQRWPGSEEEMVAMVGGGAAKAHDIARIDLAQELDWVQQGIYTEPNDQSIWLYHHWLTTLDRGRETLRITHCAVLSGELFVFFSSPACVAHSEEAEVAASARLVVGACGHGEELQGDLSPIATMSSGGGCMTRPLPATRRRWSLAWKFKPRADPAASGVNGDNLDIAGTTVALAKGLRSPTAEVEVKACVEVVSSDASGGLVRSRRRLMFRGPPVLCDAPNSSSEEAALGSMSPALAAFTGPELTPDRTAVLEGEVARVGELLEIEPDCKWALLARGRLGATLAARSGVVSVEVAEKACAEGYRRIEALDPLRRGFYKEAHVQCQLRIRVLSFLQQDSDGLGAPLDLSGLAMRRLAPATVLPIFGVRVLSVAGNELQVLGPLLLLQSLEHLDVSRNRLIDDLTEIFVLPRLRRVDVSYNAMSLRHRTSTPPPPPQHLREIVATGNLALAHMLDDTHMPTASGEAVAEAAAAGKERLLDRLLAGTTHDARSRWAVESLDTGAGLATADMDRRLLLRVVDDDEAPH